MDAHLEQQLQLDRAVPEVFDIADEVAAERFATFSAVDPFPEVPPALLNSADLLDYAAATGMIAPFRIDMADLSATLKPATYALAVLGRYCFWERNSEAGLDGEVTYKKQVGTLEKDADLILHPNTITFVELEPYFRLPRYIAARFNLSIRDIYRGILVGTGPLVDPGFEGRLSVPLHNLTSNEYTLIGGEALVWMEFTKLSPCSGWRPAAAADKPTRKGTYVEFPVRKKQLSLENYLRKAHPTPIVSSIPASVGRAQVAAERARADAKAAQDEAEKSRKTVRNVGIGAAIAALIALGGILVPTWSLINDANSRDVGTRVQVERLQQEVAAERRVEGQQAAALRTIRASIKTTKRSGG